MIKKIAPYLINIVVRLMIISLIITPVLAFSKEESKSSMVKDLLPSPKQISKEAQGYEDLILQASVKYGVDVNIITAVINQESNFNRYAKGKLCKKRKSIEPESARNCAQGLMQIVPITAKQYKLDLKDIFDPEKNIDTGVNFLADLFEAYKDKEDSFNFVLAAYNAGKTRINNFIDKNDNKATFMAISQHPDFPRETKKYVPAVTKFIK